MWNQIGIGWLSKGTAYEYNNAGKAAEQYGF